MGKSEGKKKYKKYRSYQFEIRRKKKKGKEINIMR